MSSNQDGATRNRGVTDALTVWTYCNFPLLEYAYSTLFMEQRSLWTSCRQRTRFHEKGGICTSKYWEITADGLTLQILTSAKCSSIVFSYSLCIILFTLHHLINLNHRASYNHIIHLEPYYSSQSPSNILFVQHHPAHLVHLDHLPHRNHLSQLHHRNHLVNLLALQHPSHLASYYSSNIVRFIFILFILHRLTYPIHLSILPIVNRDYLISFVINYARTVRGFKMPVGRQILTQKDYTPTTSSLCANVCLGARRILRNGLQFRFHCL